MEEQRYSKRLRAARSGAGDKSGAQSLQQAPDAPSNSNADLLRSSLDRPAYYPHLGLVMTYEQQDTLRQQITVYATICQQLVEMHKASVQVQLNGSSSAAQPDQPAATTTYKPAARHRWTPSPAQLQVLERLFELGIGTPNKHKVREIAAELSQHGSITESNVYNWFQNRKARSRRRNQQQVVHSSGNNKEVDYEVGGADTDGDSSKADNAATPEPRTEPNAYKPEVVGISLNGTLCEVPSSAFNIRRSFGNNAVLVTEAGQVVATSENGEALQPLRAGEKYRLVETSRSELQLGDLAVSNSKEGTELSPQGSADRLKIASTVFAKRSTLPALRQTSFMP